jgi:hypothetical protein
MSFDTYRCPATGIPYLFLNETFSSLTFSLKVNVNPNSFFPDFIVHSPGSAYSSSRTKTTE